MKGGGLRQERLVGGEGFVGVAGHKELGDDAADGVQDFAGAANVERCGKHDDVAEGRVYGVGRADEREGNAGAGGEQTGVAVLVGIVFNADDDEVGVLGLEPLEGRHFGTAGAAPGRPEVDEDGFAFGGLRGEGRAIKVFKGEAGDLDAAGSGIGDGAEVEAGGEDEERDRG